LAFDVLENPDLLAITRLPKAATPQIPSPQSKTLARERQAKVFAKEI
jgi:hypothetical protein